MSSIRLALSHAASSGWHIQQVDINTAFLYAPLQEEVYIKLPEGIELISETSCYPSSAMLRQSQQSGIPVVGRLLRALYGLKQAPRAWHQELTRILNDLGYKQTYTDPGVYFKSINESVTCILLIYVDDILILSPNKATVNEFKAELSKTVNIKDLGQCKQILGVTVTHEKNGITLSQGQILSQLLTATGMDQSTPVTAPMTSSYYLSRGSPAQPDSHSNQPLIHSDIKAFQSALGSLLYVNLGTRPDISFAVSVLCRSMVSPSATDQQALKHLLKYIKGTISHRLHIGAAQSELAAYSDSSYADCKLTGRSTAGHLLCV